MSVKKGCLVSSVGPKDLDISGQFVGSLLKNSEKETVARNIVILSRRNDNEWLTFAFDDYIKRCARGPCVGEEGVMNALVKDGVLSCADGKYSITDDFIASLWEFVEKESA